MVKKEQLYRSQYNAVSKAVNAHFQDHGKTNLWMIAVNPLFGYVSPDDMLKLGRYEKLINFVYDQLWENKRV